MWNMTLSVDDVMISQLTETVSGGLSPPAGHTGNLSMSHHLFILNFHLHSHRLRLPWRWGRQQHDAAVWCQHVVRTDKLLLVSHLLSGHHAKTQYTTTFSSWTKQTWNTSPSCFKPFQLLWINSNPFIQKPQKEKKNGDFMLKPDELEQQTRFYMQRLWMNSPPPPVIMLPHFRFINMIVNRPCWRLSAESERPALVSSATHQ